MHILLVEDNPGDIGLCRAALEMTPCSVELSVAKTGVDALRMLQGELPLATTTPLALVLLDLNLPLKNGFEVLAELRRAPEPCLIPVVVLSSGANPHDVNRCYELGANAYMVKPMALEEYFQRIASMAAFWSYCSWSMRAAQENSEGEC